MPTPTELAQGQLDAYNRGDADAFVKHFSPDVEAYRLGELSPFLTGAKALHAFYADAFVKSPKLKAELLNRIAVGSYVTDHERVQGMLDRPTFEAVATYQVEDGVIKRMWLYR